MNGTNGMVKHGMLNPQEIVEAISDKVFAAADTHAVYGKPVVSGNYTVITASEVSSGGGGGGGGGFGPESENGQQEESPAQTQGMDTMAGGSGVGMGGGAFGRPVAVISIGPEGVEIKPVFDVTKIGLAVLTTFGAMALMMGRMRRAR